MNTGSHRRPAGCRLGASAATVIVSLVGLACSDPALRPDAQPAGADAGAGDAAPIDAAALADAASAAPDADPSDFGAVDCREDSDCPGLSRCNEEVPGGTCNGCFSAADCPVDTRCTQLGACVRDCQSDLDCSRGELCKPGLHRCEVRSCAIAPCPHPYVCGDDTQCERPSCGDGSACPAPFVCRDDYCVEPSH